MDTENLKIKLMEKIEKEYAEYIAKLEKLPPKEIIEMSYESTMKENIKDMIIDGYESKNDLKMLLNTSDILEKCYQEWLESSGGVNTMLEESVENAVDCMREDFKEKNNKFKER